VLHQDNLFLRLMQEAHFITSVAYTVQLMEASL